MSLTPPADRYCDIVMKGGITSGVVYPPAICKLADQYHFKNIGGTSAGAIAAALTAAAEYQRRMTGSSAGFDLLAKLPKELGEKESGRTQLLRLFQPDRPCRRLFNILTGSLNATGTFDRIRRVLSGCVRAYWPASLASLIIGAVVGFETTSWHAGIGFLLVTLAAFVGMFIYAGITRGLVGNNYGMCKGLTTRKKWGPALTPWLHEKIQQAAALPMNEPLTFGHLWKTPGGPMSSSGTPSSRSIDLEMFTTNLSHGRPYMFPHVEPTARLFYKREELAAYLPEELQEFLDLKYGIVAPGKVASPLVDTAEF